MSGNPAVVEAINSAVDDLNEVLDPEERLAKSPDVALIGKDARVDSLGLVNLIVLVEEKIQQRFGVGITLVDERAMSQSKSPFRTLGSLAEFVEEQLADHGR
ncbi:MAG TPA: acyl carrier protein [Candidatus Acidoferrum sp.]|nr:acyl carrier protein [Candidatus Acidoferrum sp.]